MNKIIISGGPGSGKSTLLHAFENRGFTCVPEVSRALIREQARIGSPCVPWLNLYCFAVLCLDKMIADYRAAPGESPVFFDRGIPDIIAYLRLGGRSVGECFLTAAKQFRYAQEVFIAPPWEAIYVNDDERWQTFGEATALYREIRKLYEELGYELIELPPATIEERILFTLTKLERIEVN